MKRGESRIDLSRRLRPKDTKLHVWANVQEGVRSTHACYMDAYTNDECRRTNSASPHMTLLSPSSSLPALSSTSKCMHPPFPAYHHPHANIYSYRILTYLTVLGLIGGGGYFAYLTMNPPPKVKKGRTAVPAPVAAQVPLPATPGGAARYEEEWIPAHHLAGSGRARKVSTKGDASSGDEGARKRKVSGKSR